ncbi:MAG: quinolinate synthase NadA [Elusimicrobiota bacterium]
MTGLKGLAALGYSQAELESMSELCRRINALKRERHAVIPAHVYQRPEILAGISDFTGDSYRLAKLCAETDAETIVFCGVRFMAESAKILNPDKEVLLPVPSAGCSLADSITAADVRRLRARHPGVPVVSYINTTAEVKAESDVIVTSANAGRILGRLFEKHSKLVFLPDAWMGRNLAAELGKRLGRDLILWDGKCMVHENFDASSVPQYRKTYPGVRLLAHAECNPDLVGAMDFVGGTGDMLRYLRETEAPYYMLITECGLGELARMQMPHKNLVPMCRLCPHMKVTDLGAVLRTLECPRPSQRILVEPHIAKRARRALERMFELAE